MNGPHRDCSNDACKLKACGEQRLTAPAVAPSPEIAVAPGAVLIQPSSLRDQEEWATSAPASLSAPAAMPVSTSSAYVWTRHDSGHNGLIEVSWGTKGVEIEEFCGKKWLSSRPRGGVKLKDVMSGRDLGSVGIVLSADPRKVTETGAELCGAFGLSQAESGAKHLYDMCVELRQAHAAKGWTAEDARILEEQGRACLQEQRRCFLESIPSAVVKSCGEGYEGTELGASWVFLLPEKLRMMARVCSDGIVRADAMQYVAWLVSASAETESLDAACDPRLALLDGLVHDVDSALGSHFLTAVDGTRAVLIVRMRHVPHPLL